MNRQRKQLTSRPYPAHPPYLIRYTDLFGRNWIRRATDKEMEQGKPHCILPVFYVCACGRPQKLTPLGIWKATERPRPYLHLTNSNGDVEGIGIG